MSFPVCRHAKRKPREFPNPLVWLGSEPYRIFFPSGILFSIAGVLMWPLFYKGLMSFYPGVSHARVMIQAFAGAFVVGFLGTAGPRMLSAPRLKPWELVPLFLLHLAGGICHLRGITVWGDRLFLALLLGFALALGVRLAFFRKELPPPPLLLAATGLVCGIAGTILWLNPQWLVTADMHRLAGLLLYQGFLLGPVMGVGIFLFPRLLGNAFGEPAPGAETRRSWRNMSITAVVLVASFGVEVRVNANAGLLLRAAAFGFALSHVKWLPKPGSPKVGPLANALRIWCLPLALAGLIAPVFFYSRHIAVDHLLFVGGFGLVCLIAGSRVLFGHSGRVERFANRSWTPRIIVFAIVLAALTRVSADFLPRVTMTHYEYAAWSWIAGAGLWALWHAPRFFKKDAEE
jgi:uncharacterized protein involved in response to NO